MHILAVNPWIYDFAAYDFWLKPYGFLVILQYLKDNGVNIDFIDCLDKKENRDCFGRGKYYSQIIEKPDILKNAPRYFRRYGITEEEFNNKMGNKKPDFILLTSSMTYWYLGIKKAIDILKKHFPKTPIILGGTHATLMFKHAKNTLGCKYIFKNNQLGKFFKMIGVRLNLHQLYSTLPKYECLYSQLDYIVFRTSWGCPFNCSYCAIKHLSKGFFRIKMDKLINFIQWYYKKGTIDFTFYDDAFLYEKDYAKAFLKKIEKLNLNIRFHTPNALHIRFLDEELAFLLKRTGFINPHFGLETLNERLQRIWQNKATKRDLTRGIRLLRESGFRNGEFSFYLLLGYPKQNIKELKKEVDFLHAQGARVSLAEFSPTPRTKLFNQYKDKLKDPLLHNNSVFPLSKNNRIKEFWDIKNYVRTLNKGWDS